MDTKSSHATQFTENKITLERKIHLDNLFLNKFINFVGNYDMPQLQACDAIPSKLISFNKALTSTEYGSCVHFYIDDYQFERIWRSPRRYINMLHRYKCIIAPDFSQFRDMTYPQRIWNNYRGKFIGAFMQSCGIIVIPNVTWSAPDSYDYCFDGIPSKSVIAINSSGISQSDLNKYLWLKGYNEAIKRLSPTHIIRYGDMINGEYPDISVYFNNERLLSLR